MTPPPPSAKRTEEVATSLTTLRMLDRNQKEQCYEHIL